MVFPPAYPAVPPKVTFMTKIYHPSISASGEVCLEVLKEKWSMSLKAKNSKLNYSHLLVIDCIISLLADPSTDHPLVSDIAQVIKTDKAKFEEVARQWTEKFAK